MSTKICQKKLYFELTLVFLECQAQIGGKKVSQSFDNVDVILQNAIMHS